VGGLSTPAVGVVFLAATGVTWIAGLFLADSTDVVDDRFHLGEAIGGLILLGIAGTLPEVAITASAAVRGNLGLATGNLLGGIAVQTLVLVFLDLISRSKMPLTSLSKVLEPIIEALLVIILVSLALLGPLLPAQGAIGPVSPISLLIVIVWLGGLVILNRVRSSERWNAVADAVAPHLIAPAPPPKERIRPNRFEHGSTSKAVVAFSVAAAATLVAGVALERSGDQLATAWGINGVVFGATILAAVTALPEISSGLRAVRLGRVGLAMGDIFGGNQVQMTLFLLADLLAGKPVLQTVTTSSTWLAGVGVIVTAIYAVGLIVRPQRKIAGLGPDSWLVFVFYVFGIVGLIRITS
jgi:cation:H+ antiporter